ncbi:MAG: hypothetical protein KAY97_02370, partial [Chromatiaceae bacterium]|nr:hypothetical protein [Chromatiaceae bacterium]
LRQFDLLTAIFDKFRVLQIIRHDDYLVVLIAHPIKGYTLTCLGLPLPETFVARGPGELDP